MIKSARNANENLCNWQCRLCGRENRPFARFCGSCGSAVSAQSESPARTSFASALPGFFVNSRKKILVTSLGISLAAALFFGIHELSATATPTDRVNWGQVRTFVSKAYRLTNAELDALYARVVKDNPALDNQVNINQLLELEIAIRTRLRDNRVDLFPNPFFARPDRTIKTQGKAPFVFSDIPLDHPAYKALTPLFDIGIVCSDEDNKLRPYDRLTQAEWSNTVKDFIKLLAIKSPELDNYLLKTLNNKEMSNFALNDFFNLLRRKFTLPEKDTFAWASDPYFPGRLEAFAALSSLISEID